MKKKTVFWVYLIVWAVLFIFSLDTTQLSKAFEQGSLLGTLQACLAALDTGSAVTVAFLAFFAYRDAQRDDDWITVVICYPNGRRYEIPDAFQRDACSRSELSGIIGAIHGPGRYQVGYLRSPKLLSDLKRIKSSTDLQLMIPITDQDNLNEPDPEPIPDEQDDRPVVFWNVSNHPIESEWSQAQQEAALEMCPQAQLIDQPFPEVDPAWTRTQVEHEAQRQIEAWLGDPSQGPRVAAAMVAGEPLMCFALVQGLEARGIPCYSATTRRETVIEQGEKRSRFTFVMFRPFTQQGERP